MSEYKSVLREITKLLNTLKLIAPNAIWDVLITHDTDMKTPAVFNLWVKNKDERLALRQLLFKTPDWECETEEEHLHSRYITVAIREVTNV